MWGLQAHTSNTRSLPTTLLLSLPYLTNLTKDKEMKDKRKGGFELEDLELQRLNSDNWANIPWLKFDVLRNIFLKFQSRLN